MRKTIGAGLAALLLLGAGSMPAAAQDKAALLPIAPVVSLPSWSPLVKKAMPAVVNISAEISPEAAAAEAHTQQEGEPGSLDEFLRRYFEQHGQPGGDSLNPGTKTSAAGKVTSLGSGFIVDPAGFVVTNNHVVAGAAKITVILQDNSRHVAELVGSDPKIDLALLKIATKRKLPALQWGDSNKVAVGDWVLAVGNPFGLGGTVTTGIVSALGRDLQQGPFDDFLQIDAPINRGNSGGPTFDIEGRVIGINSAIYSPSGGSVGIGFAIPSNIARAIVQKLREGGTPDHGFLGFAIQSIDPDIARTLHLDPEKPQGLLVSDVVPQSPAAKAGLQVGDVITQADGHPVLVNHDISKFIVTARIGDVLHLVVARGDQTARIDLTLIKEPSKEQLNAWLSGTETPRGPPAALGMWFAALTEDMHHELHLAPTVQGVVIGGIAEKSPGAMIGLLPGDVLVSVNRDPVANAAEAIAKLKAAAPEGDVLILVNRHGDAQFMVLPTSGG
jgi:serine protease Do